VVVVVTVMIAMVVVGMTANAIIAVNCIIAITVRNALERLETMETVINGRLETIARIAMKPNQLMAAVVVVEIPKEITFA
jgi:hypothetical protein